MKKYQERESFRGATEVAIFATQIPQPRAEFAMALMDKFGMVAGHPDGEDSHGRAKLRLLSPDEVVARACAVADAAFAEFEKRNWLLNLPDPKPPGPPTVKKEPAKE